MLVREKNDKKGKVYTLSSYNSMDFKEAKNAVLKTLESDTLDVFASWIQEFDGHNSKMLEHTVYVDGIGNISNKVFMYHEFASPDDYVEKLEVELKKEPLCKYGDMYLRYKVSAMEEVKHVIDSELIVFGSRFGKKQYEMEYAEFYSAWYANKEDLKRLCLDNILRGYKFFNFSAIEVATGNEICMYSLEYEK